MIQRKVLIWSVIVAIGGFIFGFDTVVISGAEQAIQSYWQLGHWAQGFTISIAIVGTVFGALFGRIPSDMLGRKKSLVIIAIIFLFSALFSSISTNWYLFVVLRFIGGIGVGASSIIAPVYISEISPAEARGRLVVLFQFNIVFGIVISLLSNYLIVYILGPDHADSWRYMLGVMAVPSVLFLLLLKFIPETPRWLLLKGRREEAKKILMVINPSGFESELNVIEKSNSDDAEEPGGKVLFSGRYNFPIMLAILIAFFNQVSGINAILYYAPHIFQNAGFAKQDSLASSLILGIVNFVFTMIAIRFIDRTGRRKLMLIGSFGLIVTLGLVSFYFFNQKVFSPNYVIGFLSLFIAFFAFSQGAVIWVFISEIFPNQVRAKGQSIGSLTHWVMAAAITFFFPVFTAKLGEGFTFLFFAIMMVFQLLFVWKVMPETKGKSLEDIEHTLIH